MAKETNAFTTYDSAGEAEDFSNLIYDISPIDTPFLSSIDSTDATAVLHQWQTDALANASATNFVEEGLAAAAEAATATTVLSNTCAISDKVPRVSGTQQAIAKYGRQDEMSYQVYKRARELKRDVESVLLENNAEVATRASGTASEVGGVPAWLTSNVDSGSGFTIGGLGNTAYTDGTPRAFTEAQLKTALQSCWTAGGDPDTIMLGAFNKRTFSTFTGNATREVSASDKELYASIDIYDSDWGEMQVVPNRFQPSDMVFAFQTDMWAIAYLRPFQMHDISKTGDNETRQLLVEYTLESRNQAASAMVADLTTS
jgi:hypothetical protein